MPEATEGMTAAEFHATWGDLVRLQDAVLISINDGWLDQRALRQMPPWRAALFARVAYKAGVMTRRDLDALVREVVLTGGQGRLKPWGQVSRRRR